jgi:uncharacterized repeat protein (TIGR03803 family)
MKAPRQIQEDEMKISLLKTALLGSVLALALSAGAAQASFRVVHSFGGGSSDGASPFGGVVPAGHGGFYVATDGGGSSNLGTLTLIHKDGTPSVLHTFTGGSDGQNADGTPIAWPVDGNVYGTTKFGGSAGCGTIYKYAPAQGAYEQLYAAQCAPDSAFPFSGLVDVGGALEATTSNGGDSDDGTLIFVRSDGSSGIACANSFAGRNGSNPYAGIIPASGNEYTVTTAGGTSDLGAIVEFQGFTCNTSVLHSFAGGSDGAASYGTLLSYNGALYGTTANGGSGGNLGTVFRIDPDGSNYTVLHAFQGICCGKDGSFPHSGLTLNVTDGMLYGTTINGGNSSDNGTVFKINPSTGVEKIVHSFRGSDGAHPYGGLYIKKGTIYGTAAAGGAHNLGVVFKLKT